MGAEVGDMAESDAHRILKETGSAWLWEQGYAAVGREVTIPGLGIIDVAGAGRRGPTPRSALGTSRHQGRSGRDGIVDGDGGADRFHVVFIECKAWRADFLRDQGRQHQFAFALGERRAKLRSRRQARPRHASPALGKFDSCLIRPRATLHYLLTLPGVLTTREIPRRWGWLVYQNRHVQVVRRAVWQEVSDLSGVEGAIARALTRERLGSTSTLRVPRPSDAEPLRLDPPRLLKLLGPPLCSEEDPGSNGDQAIVRRGMGNPGYHDNLERIGDPRERVRPAGVP